MKKEKNGRNSDIAGIAMIAAGILLLLWFFRAPGTGFIGDKVSYVFEFLFGKVAFVFSGILILIGVLSILKIIIPGFWSKFTGVIIIVLMLCSLIDMTKTAGSIKPGGIIGDFFGFLLIDFVELLFSREKETQGAPITNEMQIIKLMKNLAPIFIVHSPWKLCSLFYKLTKCATCLIMSENFRKTREFYSKY